VNAVKRAVTSGRRLFTLLFALAYYAFLVFRPMSKAPRFGALNGPVAHFPPSTVDAILFAFFGGISVMLMMTLLAPRGGFRQSDVDVLFATPVSPRLVMILRMVRDYLITLLSPLVFFLLGGSNSIALAERFLLGMKQDSAVVQKAAAAAWLLMALAWVCIAYAVSSLINRSDLKADRNKKIIDWGVFLVVIGTAAYFFLSIQANPGWDTAIESSGNTFVRVVFFTATAATYMVTGAVSGNYGLIASGAFVLVGCIVLGLAVALSQLPYMYDQAAVKGFGASEQRAMRRNNDFYGLSAQQAREGKLKVGRFTRWIGRLRFSGASALVWKEILLQFRGSRFLYMFFGPLQVCMVIFPVALDPGGRAGGPLLIAMQGFGAMMLTMNSAISGFIELLKRVDFQKPLPFRPSSTVFWEVASKAIPTLIFGTLSAIVVAIWRPDLASFAIASIIFLPGAGMLVSATVFLVTIAFPDAGDATQRGFRGILILIGLVLLSIPGLAAFAFLQSGLRIEPIWAIIPTLIINVAFTFGLCFFSGRLYDAYNPSE